MGPELALSEGRGSQSFNPMNPPAFVTGGTSKVVYRDTLRRWIRMINGCAEVDTKHKALLKSSGHIIYMACDEMAKELLKQKQKGGMLNMDGEKDDENRSKMVEVIIDTIARDTPNEAVVREVDLLSNIQQCQRSGTETVPDFVCRYRSAIAKYVNQTAELNGFADRQFAIIMLRKAKISSNTMNTVVFQLTTNAGQDERMCGSIEIQLQDEEVKTMKKIMTEAKQDANSEYGKIVNKIIEAQKMAAERKHSIFNMEEAAQSLSQVKSESMIEERATMSATVLGKRASIHQSRGRDDRIQRMKAESKCRGCGETGHWFMDRPGCLKKVQEKDEERKKDYGREKTQGKDTYGDENSSTFKKKSSFFRQGGQ